LQENKVVANWRIYTAEMLTTLVIFALACASLHMPSVELMWRQLVESHGDSCWLTVVVPWAVGVFVYWVFGLLMLAVELWRYPRIVFERKIQPKVNLQTQGSQLQPPLLRCCGVVLLNQFVFMLPSLIAIVRNARCCSVSYRNLM
jgi:hypothetical protein